jgi:hypothetical protein
MRTIGPVQADEGSIGAVGFHWRDGHGRRPSGRRAYSQSIELGCICGFVRLGHTLVPPGGLRAYVERKAVDSRGGTRRAGPSSLGPKARPAQPHRRRVAHKPRSLRSLPAPGCARGGAEQLTDSSSHGSAISGVERAEGRVLPDLPSLIFEFLPQISQMGTDEF